MRATPLIISLFALMTVSACESETGVLISTSSSESLSEPIVSLRFYVGKNEIDDPLYYADSDPLEEVALEERDIASDPYRLLLSPGDQVSDEDAFVVAVLALGEGGRPIGFGRLDSPIQFVSGRVVQWDIDIGSEFADIFVTDTGCLKFFDDHLGDYVHVGVGDDADCDGYSVADGDCDDFDPYRSPGRVEDCENGIDDNCNELIDDQDNADLDDDGFSSCGSGERDCNDNNGDMYPGNAEACDGLDNDCNGLCDDRFDQDEDQVTTCGSVLADGQCVGEGEPDCDDTNPLRHPGHDEACDGIDNDCSGTCDDDPSLDPDLDGYTACGSVPGECGLEDFLVDCEPDNGDIHPGAAELCDGIDNDCDGEQDPSDSPCFGTEADNVCVEGRRQCDNGVLNPTCETVLDGATRLPGELCTGYQTCDDDPAVPDPFACLLDNGNQQPTDQLCQLTFAEGNTCPGNTVRIVPPAGMASGLLCSYAILGGQLQQGYQLTLTGENTSGQAVTGCVADLSVLALEGAGDSTVNIFFDDGAGTSVIMQVRLKTHRLEACGNLPGLSCSTWVAPVAVQP